MKKTEVILDPDTFPAAIQPFLQHAKLYDSSCSAAAKTLYIAGDYRAFLKIGKQGKLMREMEMMKFFYSHNLAPKLISYVSENGNDYLISEALDGEDGIAERYLQQPARLAEVFGASLKVIHSLPLVGCPFPTRAAEMLAESESNILRGYADKAIISEDIKEATIHLSTLKSCTKDDVVIHGDYCLPNIILQDWKLKGFVDIGTGGLGDRHYDLFWGIWTLEFNLKTDKYREAFLDAYGRADIDPDRLELCRLLAGFTE